MGVRWHVFWCRWWSGQGTGRCPYAGLEKVSLSHELEVGGLLEHTPSCEEALCFARGHKGKGRASHKTLYAPAITGSSLCMYVALLLFLGNTGSPISRGAMMTVEIVLYNEKANVCCYYPLFPHHYKKNTTRSLVVNAPNCST